MNNLTALLYFGGTSLHMVLARSGVNNSINIKARAEIDYSGIVNGEFVDASELSTKIAQVTAQCTANAKRRSNESRPRLGKLYIGVPSVFCSVRAKNVELSFPKAHKITRKDLKFLSLQTDSDGGHIINKTALYYKLDGNAPLIDPVGLTCNDIRAEISTIACSEYFIETVRAAIPSSYFRRIEFIPAPLASALYLIPEARRDETATLIESTMFSTSVATVRGEGLAELTTLNTGMAHLISDIIEVLKTDFRTASDLVADAYLSVAMSERDNYEVQSIDPKSKSHGTKKFAAQTVNDIIKSRLEVIAEKAAKALNSDLATNNLYICGGHIDAISGARDFFSKALGAQLIQCTDPFTKLNHAANLAINALLRYAFIN